MHAHMYVHTQMCRTYTHTQYYHLQHESLFISLLIIYFWKKVSISLLIINMVTHASIFVSIFSQFLWGSWLGRGGLTVECECDVLEALPASFYTDCMQLPGETAAVTQPALLLWVVNLAHVSPFPSGVLIWRAFHTILSPLPQTTVSLHYFWLLIKHLLLLRARWYQYAMNPCHVCLCLCCHPKPTRQPLMNSSVTMETVLSQLFQLAGISLAWLFLSSSKY